jgi:hypothetical protein
MVKSFAGESQEDHLRPAGILIACVKVRVLQAYAAAKWLAAKRF